jgi:hypothetical protein
MVKQRDIQCLQELHRETVESCWTKFLWQNDRIFLDEVECGNWRGRMKLYLHITPMEKRLREWTIR